MSTSIPQTMKAAAFDHFGGPEVLRTQSLPVPSPRDDQILVQVEVSGVGVWDPEVREGQFEMGDGSFPRVIGNDGAGTVVAVGERVRRFSLGDRVYGYTMDGGFYAEYIALAEDNAARVPAGLRTDQAGALGADGVTALSGLEDQLDLEAGETVMIYGASGGIGHLALQLALRLGAKVLAVASGPDGVELVRRLGAHAAVDGRKDDVGAVARAFAPEGLDAALVLTGGETLRAALQAVKKGGRVAFPNGVEPEPPVPDGVKAMPYDGTPDSDHLLRLNTLIEEGSFHVEVGRTYPLDQAAAAHRDVGRHHVGKLALRIHA